MCKTDNDITEKLEEQLRQMIVISLQNEDNDPSREHLLKCTQCGELFCWKGLPNHIKLNHPELWDNLVESFEQLSVKGYSLKEVSIKYGHLFKRKQISKALQERKKQKEKETQGPT